MGRYYGGHPDHSAACILVSPQRSRIREKPLAEPYTIRRPTAAAGYLLIVI